MNTSLRYLLPLLVICGCEFGQSVSPDEVNDSPGDQLVEFTCGDSLVTTDLPARFPLEQNRIAGVWEIYEVCGGIVGCQPPQGDTVTLVFELSGTCLICLDGGELRTTMYDFMDGPGRPTLALFEQISVPEDTFAVNFITADTVWMSSTTDGPFDLHLAARIPD